MRSLFLGAALATLLPSYVASADGTVPPPADGMEQDPILERRVASLPASPWPTAWFEPMDTIAGPEIAVKEPAFDAPTLGALDSTALASATSYAADFDSLGVYLWRDGALRFSASAADFSIDEAFNSYHMHWLLLVLATGAAVEDRAIPALSTPVGHFIDEWRDDPRGRVTVEHLLTMTAGFRLYKDSSDPAKLATHVFFGSERERAVLQWPLEHEPGSYFEYNYIVPEVLGIVLERATGQRYADYVSERLWRPLGNAPAQVWVDREGGRAYQNGLLLASPTSWLRLGALVARGGVTESGERIVGERFLARLGRGSAANPGFGFVWLGSPHVRERRFSPEVNYFSLVSEPFLEDDVLVVDGYLHRLFIVPSRDLVLLKVGRPGRSRAERGRWDDAAFLNPVLASAAGGAPSRSGVAAAADREDPVADLEDCGPPAYLLVLMEDLDREKTAAYGRALRETGVVRRHGGEYLAYGAPDRVLEGDWPEGRSFVIEQYPCLDAVDAFWHSATYQEEVLPKRAGGGRFTVIAAESAALR